MCVSQCAEHGVTVEFSSVFVPVLHVPEVDQWAPAVGSPHCVLRQLHTRHETVWSESERERERESPRVFLCLGASSITRLMPE